MKRLVIILSLISFLYFGLANRCYSQNIIDTIFTEEGDTIQCQITSVSHYSIYYKYPKGKRLKDKIMPRVYVDRFVINNKGVSVKEQKFDSRINAYIKKSKLDKKYEPLMLKENTEPTLKVLGDSIFVQKKNDYLLLALKIASFAHRHNCKLIFVGEMETAAEIRTRITLYDASDEFYHKVYDSYNQNKVLLFRTNNITEFAEIDVRINDSIITLSKNEYYEYDFNISSDTLNVNKSIIGSELRLEKNDSNNGINKYYFIGNSDNYSNQFPIIIPLFIPGTTGFIIVTASNKSALMTNFVGEFVKMNIKEYSGVPRARKGLK